MSKYRPQWEEIASVHCRYMTKFIYKNLEAKPMQSWKSLIPVQYHQGYDSIQRCLKRWFETYGDYEWLKELKYQFYTLQNSYHGDNLNLSKIWSKKELVQNVGMEMCWIYHDVGMELVLDVLDLPYYVYLVSVFDLLEGMYGTVLQSTDL